MKVGMGYDVHRLQEGREMIIGGVKIEHAKGLLGHSDADVLTHAVMDALLGAACLGDIGYHFPDTSEEYKDISSIFLLERVRDIIDKEGYIIHNIDATIIAQAPKMRPYIDDMRRVLSESLKVNINQINIKATTEEHLGFTGREEGIASMAVCLLEEK